MPRQLEFSDKELMDMDFYNICVAMDLPPDPLLFHRAIRDGYVRSFIVLERFLNPTLYLAVVNEKLIEKLDEKPQFKLMPR